jgi:4-phytase/acid phosphatase
LLACVAPAWAAHDASNDTPQIRLSIVLMRHGMRSPTQSNDTLDRYSAAPWPAWAVPPGRITPHGHEGLAALGARYRAMLAPSLGLATGCGGAARIAMIADSDNRNHVSAQALTQGIAPGCDMSYRALPEGEGNPLFGSDDLPAPSATLDNDTRTRLHDLQALLLDCHTQDCTVVARAQGRTPLYDPTTLDDPRAAAKALKLAGGFAENLMLEYVEGMPLDQVGWGRLDRAGVERVIALHNISFAQAKRPLPTAAANGSNLLAHLLGTLQVAAGIKPDAASLTTPDTRLLFLVGHDTNLANLAGLLGIDWTRSDRADAYPPGSALVFDLIGQGAHARLRIRTLMPSLQALRDNRYDGDAIASDTLPLPACNGHRECPLSTIATWLRPRLDSSHIQPELPAMQVWPTNQPQQP